jgi:hypothetical protein
MRIAIPTLALLCSSAIALAPAQSFNVDVGSVTAVPGASYGAAASQPGLWNQMPDGFGTALVGLGGAATGASVSALGANFAFWANNAGTSGDDELLLDDACDGARIYTFTGLAPGSYTLYTYAWAPDSSSYKTLVSVQGSSSPDQIVGGAWPGGHQLGVTTPCTTSARPRGTSSSRSRRRRASPRSTASSSSTRAARVPSRRPTARPSPTRSAVRRS